MKSRKAFTLIELLVVVVIIGILATIVVVNLTGAREKSKVAKTRANIRQFMGAVNLYWVDHNSYPASTNPDTSLLPDTGTYSEHQPAGLDPYLGGVSTSGKWFVDGWDHIMWYENADPTVGILSSGTGSGYGVGRGSTADSNPNIWWGIGGYGEHHWTD